MSEAVLPGATLGVLGSGQLGRMFTLAAGQMGYQVAVLAPGTDTPTGQFAARRWEAEYDDLAAIEEFARSVRVVTFEFENVPAAAVEAAARHAPVRPCGALLFATQQRLREKAALVELGLPVAPHAAIRAGDKAAGDLTTAAERVGFPSILKTAAWGYDGKGQRAVGSKGELEAAFEELGAAPAVLERRVDFEAEISVVGARGLNGEIALYEPFWNHHSQHILDVTLSPAPISAATREAALAAARCVLEGFEVIGTLCIELFLQKDGSILVNEVAPRPHNSGHVTLDSHATSQFEQQVRAICGLPLGSVERRAPAAAMANLLGDLWQAGEPRWERVLGMPDVRLHLYGKREARPGRKMGHLNVLGADLDGVERRAREAREALRGES